MQSGTIVHELFHAMGFWHEHQKFEAYKYLDHDWASIKKSWYYVSKGSMG